EVIERAKEILTDLEMENFESRDARLQQIREKQSDRQMELFDRNFIYQAIIDEIRSIDINKLTPMEAINHLHDLIRKIKKNAKNQNS
ncbi:MAG: hypothetical protein JW928_01710, partial [Candidatus Aureabacteria bacterium]|nr:hypothetical protein [Candidatus Auribacterota bacterium]